MLMADFDHISHKKLPGLPWQTPLSDRAEPPQYPVEANSRRIDRITHPLITGCSKLNKLVGILDIRAESWNVSRIS